MSDILSSVDGSTEPTICPLAIECVTFKGYATDEVCAALVGAIGMVLTDESEDNE